MASPPAPRSETKWVNYGASDGWKNYYAGAAPPSPTESSTAIFGGRVVFVAMFSGSGTDKVLWSSDEGATFTGPTSIPAPPTPPSWLADPPGPAAPTWGVPFDPVADFDDSGTAYIVELRTAAQADGSDGGRGVILYSTTNGTPNFVMQVFGSVQAPDHPWIAIYRDPAGVDQIHMAWQLEGAGLIKYTHAPVNDLPALAANVVNMETGGIETSASRVTVSQLDGTAYVAWTHGICRVQADGHCDGLLGYGADYTPDTAYSGSGSELQFPHTNNTFRAVRCFSVAADPQDSHVVYYAFQKREPGVQEGYGPMDLYVAQLRYWFGDEIDPGPRIPLNMFLDDGMHQTLPELTVSEDGPDHRMVLATWYDWNNVTCTVNGLVFDGSDWAHSACYEVYMATSTDEGLSWQTIPHVFPTVSDPALLPQRRSDRPTERFLGDYHSVTGDVLHSVHVAITTQAGCGAPCDQVTSVERGFFSHGYWNATN